MEFACSYVLVSVCWLHTIVLTGGAVCKGLLHTWCKTI